MPDTDARTAKESAHAAIHGDLFAQDNQRVEAPARSHDRSHASVETGPEGPSHIGTTPREKPRSRNGAPALQGSPSDRVAPGIEIELKLLVDAERLKDFNAAPVIEANARNRGSRKHLKSVYYDTPERTLQHNGLTLRVRRSGARFVQTVKFESADDPLRRSEWEAAVASMSPDLGLAVPFIPDKLRSQLAGQKLEAVFTADIHRHIRIVDLPSATVEVAFDQGVLKAGDRSMPISEIELELKRGSAEAIYELALRLAEHGPVRPSIRAKSARGFDLAADQPPAARKPRKLRLEAQITLDEAFATILSACLHHLLESMPAAEDGRDPEGVHQLRVALRRLRSALGLMRSVGRLNKLDSLRAEAKWLAQNSSSARDWDIFRRETMPAVAKACPSVTGFDALEQVSSKRQQAAYQKVRLALADPRCARFVLGLGAWIEARGWRGGDVVPEDLARLAVPAIDFAGNVLSDQQAKVLKRGRRFKSLGADELHRLRLAAKKLRYVADFLLPLYEDRKSVKRFSRRLAALQEELGSYNDIAITASLLDGLSAKSEETGTAIAAIAGWQARASIDIAPHLRTAWRDFTKVKTPWSREAVA